MPSAKTLSILSSIKEAILVICLFYFFALALALQIGRPTYQTEKPIFFLSMFGLFLAAIFMEVLLEWQSKRKLIFWGSLFVIAYGIIGLYLLPKILGPGFLIYGLFEPLIIVFFGGFTFVYSKIFTNTLFFSPRLSKKDIEEALKELPGWKQGTYIEKTFRFKDFAESLNFANRVGITLKSEQSAPGIIIRFGEVTIRFRPHPLQGISHAQVELAKGIERMA